MRIMIYPLRKLILRNRLQHRIFWTAFGVNEAVKSISDLHFMKFLMTQLAAYVNAILYFQMRVYFA